MSKDIEKVSIIYLQKKVIKTAYYINSEPDLVKRMLYEGHIIVNQLPPRGRCTKLNCYKNVI